MSLKWPLSLTFPHQDHEYAPLLPTCAICPTHLNLQNIFTRRMFCEQHRTLSSSIHTFLHALIISPLLFPNITLSNLSSITLQLITICTFIHPSCCALKIMLLYMQTNFAQVTSNTRTVDYAWVKVFIAMKEHVAVFSVVTRFVAVGDCKHFA